MDYEKFKQDMEQAAERVGGDFYVLPSSIHEILLVRDDGSMNRADLEDMVRTVNATEVQHAGLVFQLC